MSIRRTAVAALWLLAAAGAGAEVIRIPLGAQGSAVEAEGLPARGDSAESVLARHGEPSTRTQPVGEPPISRWDYPGFSVFFERGQVLHSVVPHRPATATAPR